MTVTPEMFKAGLSLCRHLLLGYCMWCTLPRLTPFHSDHLLGALTCHLHLSEVAQLPFLHSHSAPLTFWEAHLNWGVATPMHSLKTPLSPQHSHFGLWVPTGRQASCRAIEGICSLQLCFFISHFKVSTAVAVSLKLNLPNIRRRENGIVCKDDWFLAN